MSNQESGVKTKVTLCYVGFLQTKSVQKSEFPVWLEIYLDNLFWAAMSLWKCVMLICFGLQ
jgi:hypothetical protein